MVTTLTRGTGSASLVTGWENIEREDCLRGGILDRLGHLSPKGHAVASEIIRDVIDSLPGRR